MENEQNTNEESTFITNCLIWLKDRLKESSTWTWMVAAMGYFGYVMQPEYAEYIAGVCVSIISIIQFARKEPVTVVENHIKNTNSNE